VNNHDGKTDSIVILLLNDLLILLVQ